MIDEMLWSAEQIADATGGRIDPGGNDSSGQWGPMTIDSRQVTPGGVFVAVVAARDGHEFVAAAVAAGVSAYLYQPERLPTGTIDAVGIAVDDTGAALLDIGRAARRRLRGPVVGITGSVGKTSTKDLLAAALRARWRVAASSRSLNNELGVPLTLANAAEDTEVAVIEMGARGIGHVALLCGVAQPSVAVVTAVAAVHTEQFGSLQAIAQAKGELVEALPSDGTAVLNGDDPAVARMGSLTEAEVLRYSVAGRASGKSPPDVVAEDVAVDDELRASFTVRSPWGAARVVLGVRGEHQVGNALAALTVALRLGVDLEGAVGALGRAGLSPWRMELGTAATGALVLNDAYNANPTSVAAALRSLQRIPARRRIAVLGGMAELGDGAAAAHAAIATLAAGLGLELLAVGTPDYGVVPVAGVEEAIAALGSLGDGDAVLIKGSRVAGLERLADRLLQGGSSDGTLPQSAPAAS